MVRLDLAAMKEVLAYVRFDAEGTVLEIPTWEMIAKVVADSRSLAKLPTARRTRRD